MDGDKVLFKWSPNEIAKMNRETAKAVIEFHRRNPPTMDFFVEYTRSLYEIKLAKERIKELDNASDPLASVISELMRQP